MAYMSPSMRCLRSLTQRGFVRVCQFPCFPPEVPRLPKVSGEQPCSNLACARNCALSKLRVQAVRQYEGLSRAKYVEHAWPLRPLSSQAQSHGGPRQHVGKPHRPSNLAKLKPISASEPRLLTVAVCLSFLVLMCAYIHAFPFLVYHLVWHALSHFSM